MILDLQVPLRVFDGRQEGLQDFNLALLRGNMEWSVSLPVLDVGPRPCFDQESEVLEVLRAAFGDDMECCLEVFAPLVHIAHT